MLDDETKSAVISQTGMASALGLSSRGNALPRFLANEAMSETISAEIRKKIENPLKFQYSPGGAGAPPPSVIHGFDSAVLIDICNAIIEAERQGQMKAARYVNIVKQAHLVVVVQFEI